MLRLGAPALSGEKEHFMHTSQSFHPIFGRALVIFLLLSGVLAFSPVLRADQIVSFSYSTSALSQPLDNLYALFAQGGAGPSEANLAFVHLPNISAGNPFSNTVSLDFTTLGLTVGTPTTDTIIGTTIGPNGHTNLVTAFNSWLNQAATESSWSTMLGYYPLNYKLFINAMFNGTSVDQVAAAPTYWAAQGYPQLVLPSADIFDTPSTLFPSVSWSGTPGTYDIVRYSDTGAVGQLMGTSDPHFTLVVNPVPEPSTLAIFGILVLVLTGSRRRRARC
jgi:hypothetical protein